MIGSNGAFHHSDQNKWKWIRITLGRKFFFFFWSASGESKCLQLGEKIGTDAKKWINGWQRQFWIVVPEERGRVEVQLVYFSQVQIELQRQVQAQVQTQLQIQRRLRGVDVWKCNSFVSSTISPPSPLLLCPRHIVMTRQFMLWTTMEQCNNVIYCHVMYFVDVQKLISFVALTILLTWPCHHILTRQCISRLSLYHKFLPQK